MKRKFEIFYKFIDWHCISFGIHIDLKAPRIEIHVPTGWIRIGWNGDTGRDMNGFQDGLFGIYNLHDMSQKHLEETTIKKYNKTLHTLSHAFGSYYGTVETFTIEDKVYTGFKCSKCGEINKAHIIDYLFSYKANK